MKRQAPVSTRRDGRDEDVLRQNKNHKQAWWRSKENNTTRAPHVLQTAAGVPPAEVVGPPSRHRFTSTQPAHNRHARHGRRDPTGNGQESVQMAAEEAVELVERRGEARPNGVGGGA